MRRLTKSQYELIAAALAKARPADIFSHDVKRLQWYACVSSMAEALRDQDILFDANKFFDLCGVPS